MSQVRELENIQWDNITTQNLEGGDPLEFLTQPGEFGGSLQPLMGKRDLNPCRDITNLLESQSRMSQGRKLENIQWDNITTQNLEGGDPLEFLTQPGEFGGSLQPLMGKRDLNPCRDITDLLESQSLISNENANLNNNSNKDSSSSSPYSSQLSISEPITIPNPNSIWSTQDEYEDNNIIEQDFIKSDDGVKNYFEELDRERELLKNNEEDTKSIHSIQDMFASQPDLSILGQDPFPYEE
jgi:hypothetical protein